MKERVETDRHKETDKHTQTHRRRVRERIQILTEEEIINTGSNLDMI